MTLPNQRISSANTSINKTRLPAIFSKIEWKSGTINGDIGGGKFDNATRYLKKKGVTNIIFDPYNRSVEFNEASLRKLTKGADTITCSNVLNVVEEKDSRIEIINLCKKCSKGKVFFSIYEGDRSGKGKETSKGWQHNKKAALYLSEISRVFSDRTVTIKGNIITVL